MAMIHEEVLVIKISKLVKNDEKVELVVTPEIMSALEQVAQELAGSNAVVEVEKA